MHASPMTDQSVKLRYSDHTSGKMVINSRIAIVGVINEIASQRSVSQLKRGRSVCGAGVARCCASCESAMRGTPKITTSGTYQCARPLHQSATAASPEFYEAFCGAGEAGRG